MSISQSTIKKLYGRSAGSCNICKKDLIEDDVQIGEMAHIIAKSSIGPRGNVNYTNDNNYDNLILLCSIHHKIIDSKPDEYTVNRLHEIKQQHEDNIQNRLHNDRRYQEDLSALNLLFQFIPIIKLKGMAMKLPYTVPMNFGVLNTFDEFCIDNPNLYPFNDSVLDQKWCEFLLTIDELECWIGGSLNKNKLVTIRDMINSKKNNEKCYNIYVGDRNGNLVLNKSYLSSEQLDLVHKEVTTLLQSFIYAHKDLIDYIRNNFDDIIW